MGNEITHTWIKKHDLKRIIMQAKANLDKNTLSNKSKDLGK